MDAEVGTRIPDLNMKGKIDGQNLIRFQQIMILKKEVSEVSASDLADFFTKGVFHDADHDSEVKKWNGDLPGLSNPERFYSREMLYVVEK